MSSKVLTKANPEATLTADLKGAKELHLVVTDGGNGYGCDWADWVEPRLFDASGNETKLTAIRWQHAASGFGSVQENKKKRK